MNCQGLKTNRHVYARHSTQAHKSHWTGIRECWLISVICMFGIC